MRQKHDIFIWLFFKHLHYWYWFKYFVFLVLPSNDLTSHVFLQHPLFCLSSLLQWLPEKKMTWPLKLLCLAARWLCFRKESNHPVIFYCTGCTWAHGPAGHLVPCPHQHIQQHHQRVPQHRGDDRYLLLDAW